MATYNDKILVPNTAKDGLDTIHPETNTANVYDFKSNKWLNELLDSIGISKGSVLSGVVNFDTLLSDKFYQIGDIDASSINPPPFMDYGVLLTYTSEGGYTVQEAYSVSSTSAGDNYTRVRNETIWTPWVKAFTSKGGEINATTNFIGNLVVAFKQNGSRSTALHHASDGTFYIAKSTSINGSDWDFEKAPIKIDGNNSLTLALPPSIPVVLESGWSTAEDRKLRYYRDSFGVVQLSGAITTVAASNFRIATLPVGYRPIVEAATNFIGSSENEVKTVTILTNGNIVINPDSKPLNVSIDVSFRTT